MTKSELMIVDPQTGELTGPPLSLTVRESPTDTLGRAQQAAKALQTVITQKARPVIINGQQYLEYEDWQTVGRFYGITAKALSSEPVVIAGVAGFKAVAVAVHDGRDISAAEAY